ncbi:MAG TPA: arginine decarboxylase, pyruvoyl-dependent [Actinomycetota bacterium]|nr:arginine decarboxylase, pyruvoyl-dependent [Actinomycetota bacterium]
MYEQPKLVCLASGAAEGDSELNAFDNALRKAGVGDVNLIRVSSIVPTGAQLGPLPELPYGALTPAAYARVVSTVPGQVISACIGIGWTPQGGVIMEAHGIDETAEQIEKRTALMVEEGMRVRGMEPFEMHFATAEHTVERIGSAIAAAVLWRG